MCVQTIPSVVAKSDLRFGPILRSLNNCRYFTTYESHTPQRPCGQKPSAQSLLIPHFQLSHLYAVSTVQVSQRQYLPCQVLTFTQNLPICAMAIATDGVDKESSKALLVLFTNPKVAVARRFERSLGDYEIFGKKTLER